MKLRKKPVIVDGYQWDPDILGWEDGIEMFDVSITAVLSKCIECGRVLQEHGKIKTLEGFHIVCPGDWIITGVKGERYPCKPDVKILTYEEVEEDLESDCDEYVNH